MRVIVNLSDQADDAARQQAMAELEKRGFRKANNQDELAALGMLVGELPDEQLDPLRHAIASGGLSGAVSVVPDAKRRIAKSDDSRST
jgi:hypothetical protein